MGRSNTKKYWKGIEELTDDQSFGQLKEKEFSEYIPVEDFLGGEEALSTSSTTRRDFLKFLGFSVTAATIASCETPVTKAIPYIIKPEEVDPGVANYYASTFFDGSDYSSILVKCREGRPIHIEGNKMSSVSKGKVNARVNSSVLMLYDSNRLKNAVNKEGKKVKWSDADEAIRNALKSAAAIGGKIRILTNTVANPSLQAAIDKLKATYGGENGEVVRHITWDTISYSGMIDANRESFGKPHIPNYHFDKAKTIVSVGADFLSTWLSSIEYTAQYVTNRKPEGGNMSRHHQFECGLSVTGSSADYRTAIKPSEYGQVILNLHNAIAKSMGANAASGGNDSYSNAVKMAAKDLLVNKGNSLVVCGSNDKQIQILVNSINKMLENYGRTIDLDHPSNLRRGRDADIEMLAREMNSSTIDVLIISGGNPVLTLPPSLGFADGLSNVGMKVSTALYRDETAKLCDYTCPDNHYLESWGDFNPGIGKYSLSQPVISKLYETRQLMESLSTWAGVEMSAYDQIRKYWKETIFPGQSTTLSFEKFWNNSLHDGVYEMADDGNHEELSFIGDIKKAAASVAGKEGKGMELFLYQKTGIGDGSHARNPWLQELPDPVSKITWDNYLTMAPEDMDEMSFNTRLGQQQEANMVKLTAGSMAFGPIAVVAQPGQKRGCLGLALGYGQASWKNREIIGQNAYPLSTFNGGIRYHLDDVKIEPVDEVYHLAATQTSHTIMGRDAIVKETTLPVFSKGNKDDYNPAVTLPTHEGPEAIKGISIWEEHNVENTSHLWGMSIDLNTCIGCGSCVTACTSENNVPVVGKDEVRRSREMHWIRIDRYYSSDADPEDTSIRGYRNMENPAAQPEVVFQPMMCQQCNHAPCETVCPVAATTHSLEGLNMMAYNRCIGTRYCANNCPYKVRRFNWFNYIRDSKFTGVNPSQDDLGRMVLNPDVVVRARGVMEKCTFCVQRIQAGKLTAKKKGESVPDGSIQTACAAACPADAITFGDLNDVKSKVAMESQSDRAYRVIEEVGTRPNVVYQTKVRNKEKDLA